MDLDKPIFIITGPSASGKTSIAMEVIKSSAPITKVITTTTRTPRKGEVDDIDYHFVTRDHFETMIQKDEMFEWARFGDNYYGSQNRDVSAIFHSGKYPLWVVDVQGAEYFKKHYLIAKVFFVTPESLDVLHQRLKGRGDSSEDIIARLSIAKDEMAKADLFDYKIINRDGKLAEAVTEIVDIIKSSISR
ncbi:guanylate kinase [Patescibacteria group bacterium]|nr:guanylate kinase [Patescibacteria group bacterium]